MTAETKTVNPILEGRGVLSLNTYATQLDGCGGMRCMIEFNGVVYEMSGRELRRFRIVKEGTTTSRDTEITHWVPTDDGLEWPPSDGSGYEYGIGLEIEDGGQYQREIWYPSRQHRSNQD